MHSRLLTSLSRILLVGCAVGVGASSMYGQSSTSTPPEAPTSRIDVFLGYSYLAPKGSVATPQADGTTFTDSYSSINAGAIGSVAYYFNKYVGGQIEYANHPDGNNDGAQTAQAGIIFRFPVQGMTPFVHGLAGGVRLGGPNDEPFAAHPYTWGPALTAGGGLDYDLPFMNHRFGLRLFQADYEYFHANFGPEVYVGGRANPGNARLSTGLVVKFGNITPPPPVQYACSASPTSVFPGEPVTITGTASNLNPKKTATYTWSGQGVTVSGSSSTGNIDTASLAPGSYTVTGHVAEGTKAGESADCTAQFTVKAFEPPTVSCSANPSTVKPGDSSTITATGVSPQNRPLTYSYQASAGTVSGTGNTATLSTTGAPAGSVTVTCNVVDDKGQTASSTTTVSIEQAPPPAPKTQTLCTIQFDHDKKRPARVDNDAKGCLDDVALNAQRASDATLVVVGNTAAPAAEPAKGRHHHEHMEADLAAQRAVNTKDYLVKEKGIDASRISVRTGTTGTNEVDNYLVPAGATFDTDVTGTTAVDESTVKPQARTAPPAHHVHRKTAVHPAPGATSN
ncbi:outer membrane protein OmpA-like peptidoglycan-associated protein [Silvibacterium bohemicum]|uniref:Outer membrane protein OmpA-like peptidoglycan-associated protein n=1 Tax=Silvibacterium bohemicum TaxID=1577686 RepID=A0A841JM91_9BACT|nr:OmpA family protein [Silvibacterium bohemicum]MBB6142466.1 outer membrane protein OmpA-like peptidoglycan-associated protein [Silvibacterium bohemicum]